MKNLSELLQGLTQLFESPFTFDQDGLNEALGGLIVVSGFVLIVYFISKYTFLIRKMMIERGLIDKDRKPAIHKLDVAFMVIGVGMGLLVAAYLSTLGLTEDTLDLLSLGTVLIIGATGLKVSNQTQR